jgi:hypothetical protein
MANEILPQDDDEKKPEFFTSHGASSEERCIKMAKKYDWDYSHYELTRDPILTHNCFYKGEAKFPRTYGDNDSE